VSREGIEHSFANRSHTNELQFFGVPAKGSWKKKLERGDHSSAVYPRNTGKASPPRLAHFFAHNSAGASWEPTSQNGNNSNRRFRRFHRLTETDSFSLKEEVLVFCLF
jgi:hypothetical protein